MGYVVKEVFFTLQGEGANSGRAAVFLRFTGCNLWSGREADRALATCQFCDTNFIGTDGPLGGRFGSADELAATVLATWERGSAGSSGVRFVVCTGGEPLLQLDEALLRALHARGFTVAIETNGTLPLPTGNERVDWVCVSPKSGTELVLTVGDELKLVYPQLGAEPERYVALGFRHFFLQPMDGPKKAENTHRAVRYCMEQPAWRLSLQTHKLLGIP